MNKPIDTMNKCMYCYVPLLKSEAGNALCPKCHRHYDLKGQEEFDKEVAIMKNKIKKGEVK